MDHFEQYFKRKNEEENKKTVERAKDGRKTKYE